MTRVSRSFRHPEPAQVIDVRCSAMMPAGDQHEGRCQLFAGHDGPHAVMFARRGERLVRTWRANDPSSLKDTDTLQRPWMFGFPVPAWFEADPAAVEADVAAVEGDMAEFEPGSAEFAPGSTAFGPGSGPLAAGSPKFAADPATRLTG